MAKTLNYKTSESAFACADLLAMMVAAVFLGAMLLPALASPRSRSDRAVCANNLRQVGGAFQLWGNDHEDNVPWYIAPANGGTKGHALAPNTWFHFVAISNELRTPRILFCPSDSGQPAQDFGTDPSAGYLHPNLRIAGTSYFLAEGSRLLIGPAEVLGGDRNILTDGSPGACPYFTYAAALRLPVFAGSVWRPGLHSDQGNLLRGDGAVSQVNNSGTREIFDAYGNTAGSIHMVLPR